VTRGDRHSAARPMPVMARSGRSSRGFSASRLARILSDEDIRPGQEREGSAWRWRHKVLITADLPAAEIRCLAVETGATLWLGTDWGLYRLHPDGTSRRYTTQDSLPSLQVTSLRQVRRDDCGLARYEGCASWIRMALSPGGIMMCLSSASPSSQTARLCGL